MQADPIPTPSGAPALVDPLDARALIEQALVGIFVVQDGRVVYVNRRMAEQIGCEPHQLVGQPHELIAVPSMRDQVRAVIAHRLTGKTGKPGQIQCLRRDGSIFHARAMAAPSQFGGRPAVLVTLTDISELVAALGKAHWSADLLARTETMTRSGSFEVFLPEGRVVLSGGLRTLAGMAGAEAGHIDRLAWVPADEQGFVAGIWRHATAGEPFEFQHRILGADGQRLIVLHRGVVEIDEQGGQRGVAFLQDITAQREAELRAEELAAHDEVTGLPNRAAFLDKVDAALHAAKWESRSIVLLAIDVHRIAEVKATMGFGAGDAMAMAIAARLQQGRADDESIAHLSDTEFAIMIEGPVEVDLNQIRARAAAWREQLQLPVRLACTEIYPHCVIGVAGYPGDGEQPTVLLECAQTARLSADAESGIGNSRPGSNERAVREMMIESALRDALARNELVLHYQPQLDLSDGRIVGAEALLRWRSPTLGAVSPAEFIPVAERTGLIGAIGDWVLRSACEQIVRWRGAGLDGVRIGVNLSPLQLQRPDLAKQIMGLLAETGADPAHMGIELTEGAVMADPEQAAQTLRQIKALGIEIAIDDFGTGYSSLSCLRSLPIDVVKIDRSFVHDVTAATEDVSITRAIIALVHGLNMQVLAEGVETEGQLGLLASHHCDRIQGYLFSAAVPADDFADMLRAGRKLDQRFCTATQRQRTLLLVDDEENILSSLKRLLRRDGYELLIARSAEEGLRLMAEREPDVILSDQRMPGMTGVEFLRRAKALYPNTIRMVLSGYTELQSIIDAINEGAIYKFLTKPWDDDLLRGHVAEAFRRKEMDDENRRLNRQVEAANVEHAELNARLERVLTQQREQSTVFARSAGGMRDLLDSLPVPVVGLDADGTLSFVNRAAEPVLPKAAAMLGLSMQDALPAALTRWLDEGRDEQGLSIELGGNAYRALTRPILGDSPETGKLLLLLPRATTEVV